MANAVSVRLEVRSPQIREEMVNILRSVKDLEIQSAGQPSDLLIYEIGADPMKDFNIIQNLKESGAVQDIFLTSQNTAPEILLHAMRAGAKEFFVQPLEKDEVRTILTRYVEQTGLGTAGGGSGKSGRVVYVIGSKGGVGTTTIAVNLAASFAATAGERRVVLIDMNLLFGEVPLFLDMEPTFNWGEVAKNITRLDATYLMSVLTRHASGIHILPSPTQLDRLRSATPETVEKLLRIMREEFDFIVIDGGQSIDEISLKLIEISDVVLVVSILSLPCLINMRQLLEAFRNLGYPVVEKVRVVVNRFQKNSGISLKEAREGIDRPIDWTIPNDYQATMSAINQGKLLSQVAQRAEITRAIQDLAKHIFQKSAARARG